MESGIFVKALIVGNPDKIKYGVTVDPNELEIEPDPDYRDGQVDPWVYTNECVWGTWADTPGEAIELFQSLTEDDYHIGILDDSKGGAIEWFNAARSTIVAYDDDGYPIGKVQLEGIEKGNLPHDAFNIASKVQMPKEN